MKEFFKNKRNIAIVASVLALVLAVTGVIIYQSTKPGVEEPTTTTVASENTTEDDTTANANENKTEANTGDVTEPTKNEVEGTTGEDKTTETESHSKKQEGTTNKKPENKPVTTTRPQPTNPKPTNPSTDFVAKNPITGETIPNMPKGLYDGLMETVIMDYGSIEGYKAEVERVKNYKCDKCGKHDCPSIEYHVDGLGNISGMMFDMDKCPAKINHTAKCKTCGKPLGTYADAAKNPDKYCDGFCHIDFS